MIGFEQGNVCRLPTTFFINCGNVWKGVYWDGYQVNAENAVFENRRYGKDVPDSHLNITLKGIAEGLCPADFLLSELLNTKRPLDHFNTILMEKGAFVFIFA